MANTNADVIRHEDTTANLSSTTRSGQTSYETDGSRRLLHKTTDGVGNYWTPDNADGSRTATYFKVGSNQVVGARGTALTSALTTLTSQDPGSPDYDLTVTDSSPFGLSTSDEMKTLIGVVKNTALRVSELEARLSSASGHGLIT
jgi:hypothetical protein